jgi:hypothetical protein
VIQNSIGRAGSAADSTTNAGPTPGSARRVEVTHQEIQRTPMLRGATNQVRHPPPPVPVSPPRGD